MHGPRMGRGAVACPRSGRRAVVALGQPVKPRVEGHVAPTPLEDMVLCVTSCAVLLGWASALPAAPRSPAPSPSPAPVRGSAGPTVSASQTARRHVVCLLLRTELSTEPVFVPKDLSVSARCCGCEAVRSPIAVSVHLS